MISIAAILTYNINISSGYCSHTLPDARFVRHTVTNLTYLDKVIREADDLAKMVENCKHLTK